LGIHTDVLTIYYYFRHDVEYDEYLREIFMITDKLLRSFEGEVLQVNVVDPLSALLTAMNRYSVLPVYTMHFLVSRINLIPFIVLVAYDDNPLILSMSASNVRLQDIMADKLPGTACPTVLVFPESVDFADVIYNVSDKYYYSSSYILAGKDMKDIVKLGGITRLAMYTNTGRDYVSCRLEGNFGGDEVIMSPLPEQIVTPVKMPFINFVKQNSRYKPLLENVINGRNKTYDENAASLKSLFDDLKRKQCVQIGEANVFRDFIKLKPSSLEVFSIKEPYAEGVNTTSVCLHMLYAGTKNRQVVFYRYLDNIMDTIVGTDEEDYSDSESPVLEGDLDE